MPVESGQDMDRGMGVPASPSGCQPTASAANASSRSGIPNAEENRSFVVENSHETADLAEEEIDPWAGLSELEKDLILARQGDYPGSAGCKRIAAAYDALGTADATTMSFCWTDNEIISDRALALVRSMAALKCKNEYPKGVFGHEARRHYDEARSISRAVAAIAMETRRAIDSEAGVVAKP